MFAIGQVPVGIGLTCMFAIGQVPVGCRLWLVSAVVGSGAVRLSWGVSLHWPIAACATAIILIGNLHSFVRFYIR